MIVGTSLYRPASNASTRSRDRATQDESMGKHTRIYQVKRGGICTIGGKGDGDAIDNAKHATRSILPDGEVHVVGVIVVGPLVPERFTED
jgi:hypothetical protein